MNGSCTDVFYDVNQNIGGTASHLKRLLIDCRKMTGNLHPSEIAGSVPVREISSGRMPGLMQKSSRIIGIRSDRRKNGKNGRVRLSYEIAIPWDFLGIGSIRTGDSLGWSISISNRDSDDPHIRRDPSAIGAFELKKNAKFGMIVLVRQSDSTIRLFRREFWRFKTPGGTARL